MLLSFALALPLLAADAPVSLTASDGSGLTLVGYDADVVIAGPLAFTELRLAFDNPENRTIEGRFRLVLPDGAAISRFAMKIDGQWQEGEVVEKQAARRAYEDALHRRQDPALLEQASPNEFSARVFPIPAKARKELIVSWSQELSQSTAPWRLPLVGLPEIQNFRARVRQGGSVVVDDKKAKFVPSKDILVQATGAQALRADDVLIARVKPLGDAARAAAAPMAGLLVLLDTSASRGLGESSDRRFVADLVKALVDAQGDLKDKPLSVLAFDQVTASLYDGTFNDFAAKGLGPRRALGASDLSLALKDAAALAKRRNLSRAVIVGDGIVTAGDDGDALIAAAKALAASGITRLDAVTLGALKDEAQLRRLVTGTLAQEGTVADGNKGGVDVARRLRLAAKSKLPVELAQASWVWPRTIDGVQPGDEVLVVAELPKDAAIALKIGGQNIAVTGADTTAPAPLVRRAWARAKIDRLLEAREREKVPEAKAELATQIVTVSTTHRVLSPLTAMIVLETEADYARFKIDRKSLAQILTVNDRGLSLMARADTYVPKPPPAPEKKPVDRKESGKMMKKMSAERSAPSSRMDAADSAADDDSADSADAKSAAAPEPVEREARRERSAAPPPPAPRRAPPASVAAGAPAPSESLAAPPAAEEAKRSQVYPYTGQFAEVMKLMEAGKSDQALRAARAWREENKGDILALLALGEVHEASGDLREAARAYGSLIDLFSDRADIRRLAAARLDRVATVKSGKHVEKDEALRTAIDTWRRAAADRPDHPQGPRGYAWDLVRAGNYAEAFAVIEKTIDSGVANSGRFGGVANILHDDLTLIAAAWIKAEPKQKSDLEKKLNARGQKVADAPSLRFVLWWETDANDVDFHIHDGQRNHAYYSNKSLASGGNLYADITTGFGPECFTIEGTPKAFPYRMEAHYYSRGPMGFGMGAMRVVQHDGKGTILVEERPFIIMVDGAYVDLGKVTGPLK